MEKQPHQEYRDELADKLKEIRNSDPENPEIARAKAQGYLEAKKETRKYEFENDLKKHKLPFELGPELGEMSWGDANKKVEKLNKNLKEGESPWRLPSRKDWDKIVEPYMKQLRLIPFDEEAAEEGASYIMSRYNLHEGGRYWLSGFQQSVFMGQLRALSSGIHHYDSGTGGKGFVRLIR